MRTTLLLVALALSLSLYGDTWTNLAGQTLTATPIAIDEAKGTVTFQMTDKSTHAFPLKTFSEDEQLRLRLALGQVPIPAKLKKTWDYTTNGIVRIKGLLKANRLTQADADEQIAAFRTLLLRSIDNLNLPDDYRNALRAKASTL